MTVKVDEKLEVWLSTPYGAGTLRDWFVRQKQLAAIELAYRQGFADASGEAPPAPRRRWGDPIEEGPD